MNIVLHEMGTYTHRQELAKALSSRGHEIAYLYCPSSRTPSRSSMCFTSRRQSDRRSHRTRLGVCEVAATQTFSAGTDLRRPRVVRNRQPPPRSGDFGKHPYRNPGRDTEDVSAFRNAVSFWLEDVYSIGVKSVLSKMPLIGDLIAARYALLERKVARQSDGIVAISDDFRDLAVDWGVDPRRIAVIENWGVMPADPPPPKDNDWAARHGLSGKHVLLYSGALGFKHNPQLFLDLARNFARRMTFALS